jgi:hypothetical protein
VNIVRIRERVKEFAAFMSGTDKLANAPVFTLPYLPLGPDETTWVKDNLMDENCILPTRLPYDQFIIHQTSDFTLTLYVSNTPDTLTIITAAPPLPDRNYKEAWIVTEFRHGAPSETCQRTNLYLDGRLSRITDSVSAAKCSRDQVVMFCFAVMNPSSVTLRVKPVAAGKSVQWIESRTHYCIVHKKQAEVLRHRGGGPSSQTIERAAHHRRAHLRRLSADRYKHKKGQLVFVKQSWVGPTEWQGTDKKIYTVML